MAIIACPNCSNSISSESINCIHCGHPLKSIRNTEADTKSNQQSEQPSNSSTFSKEFTQFYSGDFKAILKTFFSNPIDGIRNLFSTQDDNIQKHNSILYLSIFIFYVVGSYIFLGESAREYLPTSTFLKIGLSPVILMLLIGILSFVVKSISGEANFKRELFTGAICGIPLGLLLIALFIIKIFAEGKTNEILRGNLDDIGAVSFMVLLYILLMLINVFQQSLKASGTKDGTSWYLSPLAILLSLFLTYQVCKNFY